MRSKLTIVLTAALLSTAVTGCTGQIVQTAAGPMPDYCTGNVSNAATGAIVGTLLGAAIGAAAGGGRGAAIGAAIGGMGGTLTGAQMEANCRQFAMQNFMQMMAQQAAAQQAVMAQGRVAQVQPAEYLNFDWQSPVEGRAPVPHRITQTSSYTDPVSKQTCGGYSVLSFANQTSSVAGTGRICTGPDGTPRQI